MIHTEHFMNRRAYGIGQFKAQPVAKLTKKEMKQELQKKICLSCTKSRCDKGYCELMSDIWQPKKKQRKFDLTLFTLDEIEFATKDWTAEQVDKFLKIVGE